MSKLEKFASFSRTIFDTASFALEHKETISDLINENLSRDLIECIRNRKILITESAICKVIQQIGEDERHIQSLQCVTGGMKLTVHEKMAGASVEAVVFLRILELVITEEKQEVVVEIGEEQLSAHNLWGRVVFSIAGLFVKRFSRHALELSTWADKFSFSEDGKTVRVSLADIPAIQKLCEQKVVNWKNSVPLRLVAVKGACHVKDGVVVELEVAEKFKEASDSLVAVKTEIGKSFALLNKTMKSFSKENVPTRSSSQKAQNHLRY